MTSIQSKEYWDKRFAKEWKLSLSNAQTIFFGNLAINNLPDWFKTELENNSFSICDAGCAQGDITGLLKEKFKSCNIIGIDFSQKAIEIAKSKYPNSQFLCASIDSLPESYDIVFTSNTLEHFNDPLPIIKTLLSNTKKYLVILVPFQEIDRHPEHLYTFDYHSFPLKLDKFFLVHTRIIDTSKLFNSLWYGKQALVIYANSDIVDLDNLHMYSSNEDQITMLGATMGQMMKVINKTKRDTFRNFLKLLRTINK
ncbi:MAG: methyltransferase type 11 [uncultured bacterium]|nr:MAG: methyltransferase type 11 [uncultured bacterium]